MKNTPGDFVVATIAGLIAAAPAAVAGFLTGMFASDIFLTGEASAWGGFTIGVPPSQPAPCIERKGRFMKKRLKPIPKFRSESEERAFWESSDNDSTEYIDWSKAKIMSFPNLRPSTRTISLRLPEDLLDTIRTRAHKLDVPYQSLMKLWLAEKAVEAASGKHR